jgi:thiamine biosynthesis lipoprotein
MKQTRILMGMPVTVEIIDTRATNTALEEVYDYLHSIDRRFSTYSEDSEISQINRGLPESEWSAEMKTVMHLCEQTKRETNGYFDIAHKGKLDPSGLVKGWAINNATKLLRDLGFSNFCLEAGGDVQVSGLNASSKPWRVGLRNPFNENEIIKAVAVTSEGVATSGTYIRGEHIYNPHTNQEAREVVGLTVIGPNIYEADRFATAAFAMGRPGLGLIESLKGFEGYLVDTAKVATLTSGFERYVVA